MAVVTVAVLCASCAQEEPSTIKKPAETSVPPVAVPVEAPVPGAPAVVDFSQQLRDPNLLDRLEDGVEPGKKQPPAAALGPRPVVIRGGDSSPVAEPPAPPLPKPTLPEEPEKTPSR
jgi:hypothetical protein